MNFNKLTFAIIAIILLSGCAQNAALLGPAITIGTTGNVMQAGIQYGTNQAIKQETGKEDKIVKEIEPFAEDNDKTVDIRSFIGINDKFLFIRELFDSNIDDYLDFITETNKTKSKKEAEKIISTKNWDKEEESTKLLTDIINRKFI